MFPSKNCNFRGGLWVTESLLYVENNHFDHELSFLVVSLLSMTLFLLDTERERESSQKYSGYVRRTESGSIIRAGCSKGHCPERGSEKQDMGGFVFMLPGLWRG